MSDTIEVRCSLCEAKCQFDGLRKWQIIAGLIAGLGWFVLPPLCTLLFEWLSLGLGNVVHQFYGSAPQLGLILWAVLVLISLFNSRPQWVCQRCNATFPAR